MKSSLRVRKLRPKRSYKGVLDSLRKVVKIEHVPEGEALWQSGRPELNAFNPAAIRIAVWNMCKGIGGVLFEHDYRSLCYRSDLVLTQEALLSQRSMRMFAEPGFALLHAASYKRRDGLRDGVMTASRCAHAEVAKRITCKYPEPIFKTPKVALVTRMPLDGDTRSLLIVNIHATLMRSRQIAQEEMLHVLSHLPDHEGPMVLAGDFNTFTGGYLKGIADVLCQIGLNLVQVPEDPRPSSQALDQIFVRGLEVADVKVDTHIRNSDHFPLLATLRVM